VKKIMLRQRITVMHFLLEMLLYEQDVQQRLVAVCSRL